MTREELEQRLAEARAENAGTCSGAWRKMVNYVEEQNAGQWREQAIALEIENERLCEQVSRVQHDAEGTVSRAWHDAIEYSLRREIERLRENLRKAERFACKLSASGQGQDGKYHTVKVCRLCRAVIKTPGIGHGENCVFHVMEE